MSRYNEILAEFNERAAGITSGSKPFPLITDIDPPFASWIIQTYPDVVLGATDKQIRDKSEEKNVTIAQIEAWLILKKLKGKS